MKEIKAVLSATCPGIITPSSSFHVATHLLKVLRSAWNLPPSLQLDTRGEILVCRQSTTTWMAWLQCLSRTNTISCSSSFCFPSPNSLCCAIGRIAAFRQHSQHWVPVRTSRRACCWNAEECITESKVASNDFHLKTPLCLCNVMLQLPCTGLRALRCLVDKFTEVRT